MKAKLVFRSVKTGIEKYAVKMDDGRKGYLKFQTSICKYATVGDEGTIIQTPKGTKFILDAETWEYETIQGLRYPIVVYQPESTVNSKISQLDNLSTELYHSHTPPISVEQLGETNMNDLNETLDVNDENVDVTVDGVADTNEPNDGAVVDSAGEVTAPAPQKRLGRPVDPTSRLQRAFAVVNELAPTGMKRKDIINEISSRLGVASGTASTYQQLAKNPEKNPGAVAWLPKS